MVIVRFIGGLGNQLFQYAAARQLALRHRTELKLDVSFYDYHPTDYTYRPYALEHFNIQAAFASPAEIARLRGIPYTYIEKFVQRVGRRLHLGLTITPRPSVFAEPHFRSYNPAIWSTPRDVYLDGYWQSEKYFADIRDILRQEFTPKEAPSRENQEMVDQIEKRESVSLHIRRGDYVSEERVSRIHGVCSLDYYYRCITIISQHVAAPHFFVFSDDMRWVKENLRLDHPVTHVEHNAQVKDYEDLRLMSLCKHNILANSSFSWWGAWLNMNPGKVVVAPRKWFSDPSLDTRDLLPEDWIKV